MDLRPGLSSEAYEAFERNLVSLLGQELASHIEPGTVSPQQKDTLRDLAPLIFTSGEPFEGLSEEFLAQQTLRCARLLALSMVVFGEVSGRRWLHAPKTRFGGLSPVKALLTQSVEPDELMRTLIRSAEGYVF